MFWVLEKIELSNKMFIFSHFIYFSRFILFFLLNIRRNRKSDTKDKIAADE